MRGPARLVLLVICLLCGWLASGCSDDPVVGRVTVGSVGYSDGGNGKLSDALDPGDGGLITLPDGQIVLADGNVVPDGTVVLPDGNVLLPDGNVVFPDGSIVLPDGNVVLPDGNTVLPDGNVVVPDGGDACQIDGDCPAGQKCLASPGGKHCVPKSCPGVPEKCNGVDDDCNGVTDDVVCDDANPCTMDICNLLSSTCNHPPLAGAVVCDIDGTACTVDMCSNGECVQGEAKVCNDQNGCTTDGCNPKSGVCQFQPVPGAACEDGNACTTGDHCVGMACVPGGAKTCVDNNGCTLDNCDAVSGQCAFEAFDDGVPCSDGNKCTTTDVCKTGKCKGKALDCNDGLACTDDECDPGQGCLHPGLDGAPCNDGLACTVGETCKGGACLSPPGKSCDDGNPCTIDGCGAGQDCTHTKSNAACDDGSACTIGDTCATGACAGQSGSCDDSNPCTTDSCDVKKGCMHVDNSAPCNDDNPCTSGDFCAGGSCVAGQGMTCNDNLPCTVDQCDAKSGGCLHKPDAGLCDDGNACTFDACLTASGCKHDAIAQCCGGKQCAAGEVCIVYPDTLAPFCAKPCNSGQQCPGSCCFMTYKTKHCLTPTYKAECCGTSEYWATETDPYACDVGGKGACVGYPNKQQPYWPSDITFCSPKCKTNADCPGTCCSGTTMGDTMCTPQAYKFLCPNF